MTSQIKTYTYPNGEIQRIQLVRWDSWADLDFMELPWSDKAMDCFCNIYRNFLVPSNPEAFGQMILFRLPEGFALPLPCDQTAWGEVADRLTAAAAALTEGVTVQDGIPTFRTETAKVLWNFLEQHNCLQVIGGNKPETVAIPLGNRPGYMSEHFPDAALKVNASFFIMDRFDCATVYDHVGTPFGLRVKDGVVAQPPLYGREALLVHQSGEVSIRNLDISDLTLEINGQHLIPGKNADLYTRPHHTHAPAGKQQTLVIVGNRVVAVGEGKLPVPASGFVLCPRERCRVSPGDPVQYLGLEQISFGIQVGNSIIRDGEKTEHFRSSFYDIGRGEPVPYPPSLYPMDFDRARAARIALGADSAGKPMLLWAEGAAKFGYVPGVGSCGASLKEMAQLCADVGMVHAINLDGGGSAQILLNNQRTLEISDRNPADFSQAERPIPLGLIIKA